jgi:hypothetical protein
MTGERLRRTTSDCRRTIAERLRDDTRGVSVTVNYALNLVVAMLLIGGVLTATGGMVEDRRDSAARTELSVLGERVAADLMAADRLAVVGAHGPTSDPTVAVEVSLPARVAGSRYEVTIDPSASEVVLEADKVDVTVRVGFHHETPVAETTVRGGDLRIVLNTDPDPDQLEVSEA